jgi:PAS domain S-box-containing protein
MDTPSEPAGTSRPYAVAVGPTSNAARAHDWAATPLGPMESWPQALKTVAGIVLGSNIPMLAAWGPDLLVIHNDSYGEILGDRRPALGRPLKEIWSDIWDMVGGNAARVLAGETIFMESAPRPLKREGLEETAWITSCYHPILGESGAPEGIFGVVVAVGMDEVSEERLRESEERFRLIADSAPVPMWVTRLDRRRDFVNRAYVDFLGITYEQAIDYDWREIIHPDDVARILAESVGGEATLEPFVLEGRFRRGDGEWRWLRSISQPRWGPGGEHVGFIGAAHDITDWKLAAETLREVNETLEARVAERTADLRAALDRLQAEVGERERAEEALRQAQKMEAVGQLTGGLAHDFNNLLTPVIGGLEIIARSLEEPRLRRVAETALESSRRGAKLTSQLLAFSRIQRIRMAPVRVNRVIETMKLMLKHTIGSAVTVRTRLGADAGLALCDENQLENAILNLAINARDAMLAGESGGGTLTISTGLSSEPDSVELEAGDYVFVAVADTGQGMSPEVAARAIEPFFSTKPLGRGTGLGLAQVYGIARQSGGTLRIESREGEGTTVRLLLPRAEGAFEAEEKEAEARVDAAGAAGPGGRIFVVDDDADVREFLADSLVSLGHRVVTLAGAEAALDALEAGPPDLMLIDFAMPGMNGAELARETRARFPGLPIVFVTGFAESDQIEGACGAGVPILRKPFGIDELAAAVSAALADGAT